MECQSASEFFWFLSTYFFIYFFFTAKNWNNDRKLNHNFCLILTQILWHSIKYWFDTNHRRFESGLWKINIFLSFKDRFNTKILDEKCWFCLCRLLSQINQIYSIWNNHNDWWLQKGSMKICEQKPISFEPDKQCSMH